MPILLLLKSFFGGILEKVLGNPKVLLVIVIAIIMGIVALKVRHLESEITVAKQQVVAEQKNNEVLRGNAATLETANAQNKTVIDQLTLDRQNAINSVTELSARLSQTNKTLTEVQQSLEQIKAAPTKLTPYLSQAINGIQKARDAAGAPK